MNKFQESWSKIVAVCFDRVYLSMRGMVAAHYTIANGSSQFSAVIKYVARWVLIYCANTRAAFDWQQALGRPCGTTEKSMYRAH
jgi:hypothetical protein